MWNRRETPETLRKQRLAFDLSEQLYRSGEANPALLHEAAAIVKQARLAAKPIAGESELVVLGTLMPDRRLNNIDMDLHHLVLMSVRRRFHVGEPPNPITSTEAIAHQERESMCQALRT